MTPTFALMTLAVFATAAPTAPADPFSSNGACSGDALPCRRIVLAALRSTDAVAATEALAIYAVALQPGKGAYSAELAMAAADIAERSGAPAYAASLLSSSSAAVADAHLGDHLLRAAELYVSAGDPVRARVIVDFARTRRRVGAAAAARWSAVSRGIAALRSATTSRNRDPVPRTPELAMAARALERARAARNDAAPRP